MAPGSPQTPNPAQAARAAPRSPQCRDWGCPVRPLRVSEPSGLWGFGDVGLRPQGVGAGRKPSKGKWSGELSVSPLWMDRQTAGFRDAPLRSCGCPTPNAVCARPRSAGEGRVGSPRCPLVLPNGRPPPGGTHLFSIGFSGTGPPFGILAQGGIWLSFHPKPYNAPKHAQGCQHRAQPCQVMGCEALLVPQGVKIPPRSPLPNLSLKHPSKEVGTAYGSPHPLELPPIQGAHPEGPHMGLIPPLPWALDPGPCSIYRDPRTWALLWVRLCWARSRGQDGGRWQKTNGEWDGGRSRLDQSLGQQWGPSTPGG